MALACGKKACSAGRLENLHKVSVGFINIHSKEHCHGWLSQATISNSICQAWFRRRSTRVPNLT